MSDPFIGEIKMFGGNFAIRGFALCDGQLLAISQNTALFSILGTIYCRDGETTLGLPDLKGRTPKHPGQGPGLTNISLGEKGGVATQTLTEPQMASHTHPVSGTKALGANQAGNSASPSRQRAGRHHGGSIPTARHRPMWIWAVAPSVGQYQPMPPAVDNLLTSEIHTSASTLLFPCSAPFHRYRRPSTRKIRHQGIGAGLLHNSIWTNRVNYKAAL